MLNDMSVVAQLRSSTTGHHWCLFPSFMSTQFLERWVMFCCNYFYNNLVKQLWAMWIRWKELLPLKDFGSLTWNHTFLHSLTQQTFTKHLHVPGIVLGTGDTAVNKKSLCGANILVSGPSLGEVYKLSLRAFYFSFCCITSNLFILSCSGGSQYKLCFCITWKVC